MINEYELIYVHDENNVEIIAKFSSDRGLTIDQALCLCGVNMDDYADEQGWDGYDYNSLEFRIVN